MNKILPILLSLFAFNAHAEKWKMTTLEWPPFVCAKCPDMGAGAKALKEALKSVGVELELEILPWTRAIVTAADSKNYVGGFLFYTDEVPVDKGFVRSPAIFKSPIIILEPKGKALTWNTLADLKGKRLGTVQDYNYGTEMMSLFKDGTIAADVAISDDINIKKVAGGRISGAVIDINVAKYMIKTNFASSADKVQYNPKIIENKDLLAGFNKENASKNAILIEALKKVNTQAIVDDYLKNIFK